MEGIAPKGMRNKDGVLNEMENSSDNTRGYQKHMINEENRLIASMSLDQENTVFIKLPPSVVSNGPSHKGDQGLVKISEPH